MLCPEESVKESTPVLLYRTAVLAPQEETFKVVFSVRRPEALPCDHEQKEPHCQQHDEHQQEQQHQPLLDSTPPWQQGLTQGSHQQYHQHRQQTHARQQQQEQQGSLWDTRRMTC